MKVHKNITIPDILMATKNEIATLQHFLKNFLLLSNARVVQNAIRRYETIWLPLMVCLCFVTITFIIRISRI